MRTLQFNYSLKFVSTGRIIDNVLVFTFPIPTTVDIGAEIHRYCEARFNRPGQVFCVDYLNTCVIINFENIKGD